MFEEYAFFHKKNGDLLYASLKHFMFKDYEVQDTALCFWRSKLSDLKKNVQFCP